MLLTEGKKPLLMGFVIILATLLVLPSAISAIKIGNLEKSFTYSIFMAGGILLGIMISLRSIRELSLTKKECHYRNLFGKKRDFQLNDIARVELKKVIHPVLCLKMALYNKEGQRLASADTIMPQWDEALEFLRKQGIEISGVIVKKKLT